MVYIKNFEEFISKSEALCLRDPHQMNCSTKVRGADDAIVLKVTNNEKNVS